MKRLRLFNPENDIALAVGKANFTAPPAALEMRRMGELLPFFLAEDCDRVIVDGVNARFFDAFREKFSIKSDIWDHSPEGFTPAPWGWSYAARRYFENAGFAGQVLPTDSRLDVWRGLSHRRTAALIGDFVAAQSPLSVWPRAVEARSAEELEAALAACRQAVVKLPWSSSGRGVRFFDPSRATGFIKQAVGSIKRQGSVMVERYMPGHQDFALLYETVGGSARFVGPSVFIAAKNGDYSGNLVGDYDYLTEKIENFVNPDELKILISSLSRAIDDIISPFYDGPVGVDICCADGKIHICEANLRYTMGFVARGIARLSPRKGILTTSASPLPDDIPLTQPGRRMKFILRPS